MLIGFSPAVVDGSCPFAGLSMPPTEEDLVLIGGGGSGGCFAVWRLDMVGSEGIKLVCNGENGRRTETQSGISIRRIVYYNGKERCEIALVKRGRRQRRNVPYIMQHLPSPSPYLLVLLLLPMYFKPAYTSLSTSSSAMASVSTRQRLFCFWNICTCSFQRLSCPHEEPRI